MILQPKHGPFDLIGLREVRAENAARYAEAFSGGSTNYKYFLSTAGGHDRLLMTVNTDRFRIRGGRPQELPSHDGVTFPGAKNRRPFLRNPS